jgi:hypothetical protein
MFSTLRADRGRTRLYRIDGAGPRPDPASLRPPPDRAGDRCQRHEAQPPAAPRTGQDIDPGDHPGFVAPVKSYTCPLHGAIAPRSSASMTSGPNPPGVRCSVRRKGGMVESPSCTEPWADRRPRRQPLPCPREARIRGPAAPGTAGPTNGRGRATNDTLAPQSARSRTAGTTGSPRWPLRQPGDGLVQAARRQPALLPMAATAPPPCRVRHRDRRRRRPRRGREGVSSA